MNEQQPTTIPTEPQVPVTRTEPKRQLGGPDSGVNAADEIAVDTAPHAALGIDLGTRTTNAAAFVDGAVRFVEPCRLRSSLYIAPDRKMYVGSLPAEAKPNGIYIDGLLPLIGTDWSVQVGKTTYWNVIDCLSKISAGARAYAQQFLAMDVINAALTVPHSFNARQRRLLKSAVEKSGIETLALINEATASALHYCFENRRSNCTMIVVSIGAGFLNVSLIEVHNKIVEVKYTVGHAGLGGAAFEEAIGRWLTAYVESHGETIDLSDSCTNARFKSMCEEAAVGAFRRGMRHAGTHIQLAPLELKDLHADKQLVVLSAEQSTALTLGIMQQINRAVEEVTAAAAREGIKPECALLSGNAAREASAWLSVTQKKDGGMPWHGGEELDLYPAGGASLYAALLAKQLAEWVIWDALTSPIGVELPDGSFANLVSKNTPLPVNVHHTVEMPEAGRLKLKFFQGNDLIDEVTIKDGAPGLPRPRKVEIGVHLHADGTISYSARDRDLGITLSLEEDTTEPVLVELT